jgi:hypothetical protein
LTPKPARRPSEAVDVRLSVAPWSGLTDRSVTISEPNLVLVGDSTSKEFGISFRAKITSTHDISGTAKLVAYLYKSCEERGGEPKDGVHVGVVELETLEGIPRERTLIVAKESTKAFAPMQDIKCAKVVIECPTCTSSEAVTIRLDTAPETRLLGGAIAVSEVVVDLTGEANKKDFGLTFRGKVDKGQDVAETSSKLMLFLYADCDNKDALETAATSIGAVELTPLSDLGASKKLIVLKVGTAFVPMGRIKCAKFGLAPT